MVARQLGAATRFPRWHSYKAYGHGRAMLAPTGVFRQSAQKGIVLPFYSIQRIEKPPSAREVPRRGGGREPCHSPKYFGQPYSSLPHRLRAEPPRRGGQGVSTPFSTVCYTIIMTQSALFCNSAEKKRRKAQKTIQMVGAEIVRFLYDEDNKSYSLQGRRAAPCGGSFWTRNTL